MTRERLELVKDFGKLRVGMKVKVKNKGKLHDFFLLRKEPLNPHLGAGDCFVVLPNVAGGRMYSVLGAMHVERRQVFRVADGLEKEQTTETRKTVKA